ncbi:hypothetical protein AN641_05625 [Candidatus Epulonipiscioides gigas]|nr:hypothetical protein AN641_07745 [Epulopiscium sp. SCG-C07WGA-EpuloA2]ONI44835.1 hypothetical protein AN641_05625 [Epulopiscium sp. SCG-C07WGA-EpuloA2]
MSYELGMAAFNLEMPDVIPRTEYSAHMYWELIEKVTGVKATPQSTKEEQMKATQAFVKAWDYSFFGNAFVHIGHLNKCRTKKGHATFASGGVDFSAEVSCPFSDPEECLDFDPIAVYGEVDERQAIKDLNASYYEKCDLFPNSVNTQGTYITLVTGLIEIFGWEMLLLALAIDGDGFGEVANRYTEWIMPYFRAMAQCDTPILRIHDDIVWTSGAFVNPKWYRKYVFPNYKKMFAPLKEAGKKVIYLCDGNYTEFIDDVADCGVDGFVMEPTTDMKYIAEKYGKTHSFIGNADTRVLLNGTKDEIYAEVKRCIDIGKNCPGFFMAVGNHIPSNTPIENALFYNEVFNELKRR